MSLKRCILFLLIVSCAVSSSAQKAGDLTQSRILILLDRSSSMIQPWANGKQKYKAADELITALMDSMYAVNDQVEFGLRVFGHEHTVEENNCQDTRNEVAFTRDNRAQMALRLASISPLGVTAIAYSLKQAANYDIVDIAHNAYSIILITDGGESCGGDICDVMRTLIDNKVYFKPYIISLEDYPELKKTYDCMGNYLQVTKNGDIPIAVGAIVNAFRPVLKITNADYKQLQSVAANTPKIMNINVPAIVVPADSIKAVPVKKPDTVMEAQPLAPPPYVKPPVARIDKLIVARSVLVTLVTRPSLELSPVKNTPPLPPPVIEPIFERPAPDKIASLKLAKPTQLTAHVIGVPEFKPIDPGKPLPPPVIEEPPVPRAADKIARLEPALRVQINIGTRSPIRVKAIVPGPSLPLPVDEEPVITWKPEKIAKLKLARLEVMNSSFVVQVRNLVERPVPPPPIYKPIETPVVTAPPQVVVAAKPAKPGKPVKVTAPPEKKREYKVETEDALETSVEVLFTNGQGKYYNTTPLVLLLDPASKAVVKKFYRTVDEQGNPDLQTEIPVGTYDLTFAAKRDFVLPSVRVEKNKKNKITVVVKSTSLRFQYQDAPGRPMTEFVATVIERNKPQGGRVEQQKCTQTMMYEQGNYHIVINTFPESVRNTDIEFDDETIIKILQPGFAKFTSTGKVTSVAFHKRDGDKFVYYKTFDLTDPRYQHLAIQPGEYQVHYQKGPVKSSAAQKVVSFVIKATQLTEVIID